MRALVIVLASSALLACEAPNHPRESGGPFRRDASPADAPVMDFDRQLIEDDAGTIDTGLIGGDAESREDAEPREDGGLIQDRDATIIRPDGDVIGPDDAGTADSGRPPLCMSTCNTAGDCVYSPTAITDSDNYSCDQNRCNYHGCNNTAECQTTFNSTDYICVTIPAYLNPTCLISCTVPSDCETAGSPLFGADNYSCTNGGCEWLGCNTAQECRDTFQDPSYVCELQPGGNPAFKSCIKPCATPNDCGAQTSPAYDADNYSCTNQRCVYLGCNNTAECTASFPSVSYVCE